MAKRALAALLALAAALAFVVAIASSAWWSGHPVVNGRPITAKDVHVGLLGAEGCNTGGDGSCEAVEIGGALKLASYAELGATGLATLLAFLVAVAAWRIADNRKSLAKASLLMTLLAAAGGGAVLALGPAIKASQTVDVPIGWGLFVFIGAIASSLLASTITRGLEPEPLRLKPTNAPLLPPVQTDVRQLLQGHSAEPAPRDSASLFNAAPQLRPLYDPQNAGYSPAPVAPTLPQRAPTPMPRDQIERLTGKPQPFSPPQNFGGSPPQNYGGSPPQDYGAPEPLMPGRSLSPPSAHELDWSAPPTPAPVPSHGRESPPPFVPQSPPSQSSSRNKPMTAPPQAPPRNKPPSNIGLARTSMMDSQSPPPPPRQGGPGTSPPPVRPTVPAPDRSKPPTNAPPTGARLKPPSNAPSIPSPGAPARSKSPTNSKPPMSMPLGKPPTNSNPPMSVPLGKPPASTPLAKSESPADRSGKLPRAGTIASGGATPAPERTSSPAIKPQMSSRASEPRQPTLAHAVPPMPRASTENDDRLETGMRETEFQTAVEIDHEAKAAAQHTRKATEDVRTGGNRIVGDVTDPNVETRSDAYDGVSSTGDVYTDANDSVSESTDIGAAPSSPDATGTSETFDANATNESFDANATSEPFDANATMEQNPKTSIDLSATMEQNPKTPVPTPSRAPSIVSSQTPVPTLDRAASVVTETPAPTRAPSVPMSTAPSSLPPPKETSSTYSGPTPACPQCESPMAWVDEHLRFYCRTCRMYF